jgi:hypothetical protein
MNGLLAGHVEAPAKLGAGLGVGGNDKADKQNGEHFSPTKKR